MTTAEKAHAYDEALTKAKTYLTSDTPDRVDTVSVITTIFPELKESKGERIRKALLDAMNDYTPDSIIWDDIRAEEITAWLEKQKHVNKSNLRTWKYIVDAVLTEKEGIGNYLDNPWTIKTAEKLQKRFGNIE